MAQRANFPPGQRYPALENGVYSIDIAVRNKTAIVADIFPYTQWHGKFTSAGTAIHAGVAGINLDKLTTGTLSPVAQLMSMAFSLLLGD